MPLTAEIGGRKVAVGNIVEALELSEKEKKDQSALFTVEIPGKNVRFSVSHLDSPIVVEERKDDDTVRSVEHHNELKMLQKKAQDGPWVQVMRFTARNQQEILHVLGDAAIKICNPPEKPKKKS
ncbi:MAG: hypothetical protein ACW99U_12960 [Candidatus Thorarchaeota archaeon]|jgi:hypothetical protein